MNRTTLLLAGGVLLVGAIALGIYYRPGSDPEQFRADQNQKLQEIKEDIEGNRSLSDYLFGGASAPGLKCEQTAPIGEQSVLTVTAYIAGERVAAHYNADPPVQGQSNMHLVTDGEYGYIWGDAYLVNGTNGLKIDLQEQPSDEDADGAPVDYDMALDHCEPWEPDANEFMIPPNLEFQTLAEMMGDLGVDGVNVDINFDRDGDEDADPCSACGMMQPDQQSQCRQAMGCN